MLNALRSLIFLKIGISLLIIIVLSSIVFTQAVEDKAIRLSVKEISKRIIKRQFPDPPESVRECHATGSFNVLVRVSDDGNVQSSKIINGFCKSNYEYLERTVSNWKFKPLKINKAARPFRGIIVIPFWYGTYPLSKPKSR